MRSTTDTIAVTDNGANCAAAYASAVTEIESLVERRTALDQELSKVRDGIERTIFAPGDLDLARAMRQEAHVEHAYPIEAAGIRCRMDLVKAEYRKNVAWCEWGCELDRRDVRAGNPDAGIIAALPGKLGKYAAQYQQVGDSAAIVRGVKATLNAYRGAVVALTARRLVAAEPPPQANDGLCLWRALLEVERNRSVGLTSTPRQVLRAGRGYPVPGDGEGMTTVDEALDVFRKPQPPSKPAGKLEALQRELNMLNAAAFALHEQQQAALAEAAEQERLWKEEQGAQKRQARDANVLAQSQAALNAQAARERWAKIEAFAEARRRETPAGV